MPDVVHSSSLSFFFAGSKFSPFFFSLSLLVFQRTPPPPPPKQKNNAGNWKTNPGEWGMKISNKGFVFFGGGITKGTGPRGGGCVLF